MNILDLLFPKFCVNCKKMGDYVCDNCFNFLSFDVVNICAVCSRPSIDGATHPGCRTRYSIDQVFVGIEYNLLAKRLIYNLKYKPYVSDLSKFLADLLYESLIQKEDFIHILERNNVIFVPIPLSPSKERRRGYNQSALLSKVLASKFGVESEDLLIRIKETKTQAGLTKKERRENMENAFKIKEGAVINGSYVFLVDDILTTGSTLNSAAQTLKKAGFKKAFGIALAKEK